MGTVVDFPMSQLARARFTIRSCAAEYARAPSVENGRELVFSVQAYWDHLAALGIALVVKDSFLDMNASTTDDKMVLACANSVLRALRLAERKSAAR
jgi:hypothetical protein